MPIPQNKVLESLLDYSALKQKVIGQNIANSETNGYKRRDVEFKKLLVQSMEKTPTSNTSKSEFEIIVDESQENASGVNNVDVNREMAELAQNTIMFKFAAKKLNGYYQSLQNVIRGGK